MNENTIDWNEIWKNQTLKQVESHCVVDCASIWEEKKNAKRFWEMSLANGGERIEKTISGISISPDSKVLDVGAGPGTLAVPLAERVVHVTAVEPSEGMMNVLQDNISEYETDNITCVQKRWEDVNVEVDLEAPYDVVIASFSLGMPDIRESIQKMIDASSRYVYLYWFAGEPSWDIHYRTLWPSLHDSDYHPGPKCDVLYNVLYQMGIYPHAEVFPLEHVNRFHSVDEAVEYSRSHYKITTDRQESVLRDYLEEVLEKDNDSLIMRGSTNRVKMWWEKNKP
ncbi:class I SAM-dependent methyltransferase [Methanococcoides sp. AM1]|uniref:class I SAM-dependent methyltransferase n=1 Tax=Methanococcoides sp. AM1 TaxID=1201011 RepID=UPI0010831FA2|nr:class I SAM-dependent methyltransferase [Methanococcoides sp. AM1]